MQTTTRMLLGSDIHNYQIKTPETSVVNILTLAEGATATSIELVGNVRGQALTLQMSGSFSGPLIAGETVASVANNSDVSALVYEIAVIVDGVGTVEQYLYSDGVDLRELAYFDHSEIGLAHHYRGDDYFYDYGNRDDAVFGFGGDDHFFSTKFEVYEDKFFGGDGTDHLHLVMHKDYYSIENIDYVYDPRDGTADTEGLFIRDNTADGVDNGQVMTNSVERVHFSDISIAYDLDGHAGSVAKTLGAVFGEEFVNNQVYVGVGLSLLDGGMSDRELMALALDVAGLDSNEDLVDRLWVNIYDTAIDENTKSFFVGLLDGGVYEMSDFALLAADTTENIRNIDLVGLSTIGIEYMVAS